MGVEHTFFAIFLGTKIGSILLIKSIFSHEKACVALCSWVILRVLTVSLQQLLMSAVFSSQQQPAWSIIAETDESLFPQKCA